MWFTVVAAILGVFAWAARLQSVTIAGADISNASRCEIGHQSDEFITGLTLIVSGEIDGRATIALEDYKGVHTVGPGPFEIDISPHEYYSSQAKVRYSPENVTNGHLKIQYAFH